MFVFKKTKRASPNTPVTYVEHSCCRSGAVRFLRDRSAVCEVVGDVARTHRHSKANPGEEHPDPHVVTRVATIKHPRTSRVDTCASVC